MRDDIILNNFRNIAIHSYTRINYAVVRTIVEKDLDDFEVFLNTVLHISSDES